jgi:hypothetical protein
VGCSVPFSRWASGAVKLGNRPPTAAALATHLSTLFPPVRLRGYLEVRYLDMSAPRWWPAIAVATSARRCLAIAAGRVPAELRPAGSPHWERWHIHDLVVRDLEQARNRTLGLTDLDDPTLGTRHDLLMSPLVWDLAHVPTRSLVIGWPTRCPSA